MFKSIFLSLCLSGSGLHRGRQYFIQTDKILISLISFYDRSICDAYPNVFSFFRDVCSPAALMEDRVCLTKKNELFPARANCLGPGTDAKVVGDSKHFDFHERIGTVTRK